MMNRSTPSDAMDWERPSDRFLAYLERLAAVCVSRDRDELDKLMRMRMSSHLPRVVLDELEFFRRARAGNLRAPLKTMRYVHQMRQLASAETERTQLQLELRERELSAPPGSATRKRTPVRRSLPDEGKG
ncbi:MAG: hypothetical protein ACREOK_06570 [Gemmatimonadaceae bacterium]